MNESLTIFVNRKDMLDKYNKTEENSGSVLINYKKKIQKLDR